MVGRLCTLILLHICATKCLPSFVSIRFPTTIPKDKRSQMHPSLILQPSLPREKWVGRNGKDEKLKRQLDLPAKVSSKLTERNVCVKIYILFNLHFCRTPTRSDQEVRLSRPPTTHHHPPTTLSSEIEICTSDSPTPPNPYIF